MPETLQPKEQTLAICKALGDETRLKVVQLLSGGELCACKILESLDITQPTLSHHMKLLCDSGIVQSQKVGKWQHYTLNPEAVNQTVAFLEGLLAPSASQGSCPCTQAPKDHIDLYVLTGFLGSGKTTVLLKILSALKGCRVGVLQNEFGKTSIDGEILRDDDIKMVELNRGSIFCSCLKLSFVEAMAELAKEDLQYLFVESSGWGDPSNVQELLGAIEVLAPGRYQFKGMICLVDALNFEDQLADMESVERQLKHCHLATITKVDLVEPEKLDFLREKIRSINPNCRIAVASFGDLDFRMLQEDLTQYQWAPSEESTNSTENKPKSVMLHCHEPVEKDGLVRFLQAIQGDSLRIKGFFDLVGEGWQQVDVVGKQIDFKPCEPKDHSYLVLISRIGPKLIREAFAAWEENLPQKMELKN